MTASTTTLGGWLVHVMRQADGALSLEEALHALMDSMKSYFPCQSVAVILIDEDTKELRIKISRQISYAFAKRFHQRGPSPVAERVVLAQEPVLLNNVAPDSELYRELRLEHDFTSAVLAPVVRDQKAVGYVFADRRGGPEFTESDMLHLQVIGLLVGTLMGKFELLQTSRRLSSVDDASGGLQYKAFVPALATELERARTHGYPLTLALITVDAFRAYIDTFGINQAHALLAEVVKLFKAGTRDMDLLARFGADEFILCLSGLTIEEATAKLEELRQTVLSKALGQGDAPVTLTLGALMLRCNADMTRSLQDILSELGKCLVNAKGKNGSGRGPITVNPLPPVEG